ncbi:hypothetical protein MLD38_022150 [Melastoma candidum]|uniref:Uncharacterized protein n=1 Tax=Melastoma candidum TaxID=119954 RepID=A0ACB9QIJ5_9MYRT|nr:hypothetical protein MLD38_022150 [Melastoma candidum]
MEETKRVEEGRICTTGAGGYIASWVVKLLLLRGYKVHGTVRDPRKQSSCGDPKNAHLKSLENVRESLRLFKAELLDYESIRAAVSRCTGVLHVDSPVPAGKVTNPEVRKVCSMPVRRRRSMSLGCCQEDWGECCHNLPLSCDWPDAAAYSEFELLIHLLALMKGKGPAEHGGLAFMDVLDTAEAILLVYERALMRRVDTSALLMSCIIKL